MGGYDTSVQLTQSLQSSAVNKYGTPNYGIRYFPPSPAATTLDVHPFLECDAIWDSGAKHLSPISEPDQTNLGMDSAQGHADAQTFINTMVNVWTNVGPLTFPTGGTLYSFLGQENSTHLSSGYWSGWASYVNGFVLNGSSPFFASLYCTPGQGNSCTVIQAASGASACFIVWSAEVENSTSCRGTLTNPPSWNATFCSGISTNLWQFAEKGACGLTVDIDMDLSNMNFPNFCFYLKSRP